MPPLSAEKAKTFRTETPEWKFDMDAPVGRNNSLASLRLGLDENVPKAISREWKFKNFKEAMAFANKVAELAEQENHHPDIFLHGWNKVRLTLSTHAIKGLSENDFIMAAKCDIVFNDNVL